jgi:hypothetical protein
MLLLSVIKLFRSVINSFKHYTDQPAILGLFLGVFTNIVFLYPLIIRATTHLTSREDGIFIAWTINWVSRALTSGQTIFNAPIFYPYQNTLAFSDPFLTSGVTNIFFSFFTRNLILQHNFQLILGMILCFWGMYMLAHYQTKHVLAAYVSSVFFTFSSLHLHYLVHLHTLLVGGIPCVIYCFLRWRDSGKMRWLVVSNITVLAQTLNSPMTGFFSAATLLPFAFQKNSLSVFKKNKMQITSVATITLSLLAIFYLPYFQNSSYFSYTRSIRDAAHFAHSLNRIFTVELFIVYLVLLTYRKKLSLSGIVIALIGAVLMLGPVVKINNQTFKIFDYPIPLPYAVLYYIVPGFKAFRASSRWIIVFNLGLSLLLGQALAGRNEKKRKLILATGLTIFLWFTQIPQLKLYEIPLKIPTIYESAKVQSAQTLAEFPVYVWSMHPYVIHENDRLLYQPFHGKKMYNGVSGFTPPDREQQWANISQQFPAPYVLDHLRENGVTMVLVHFNEYDELYDARYIAGNNAYPSSEQLRYLISKQPMLREIQCNNVSCLYTIEK